MTSVNVAVHLEQELGRLLEPVLPQHFEARFVRGRAELAVYTNPDQPPLVALPLVRALYGAKDAHGYAALMRQTLSCFAQALTLYTAQPWPVAGGQPACFEVHASPDHLEVFVSDPSGERLLGKLTWEPHGG